jgi:hypothetical protein
MRGKIFINKNSKHYELSVLLACREGRENNIVYEFSALSSGLNYEIKCKRQAATYAHCIFQK